jgi:hypothetical protein
MTRPLIASLLATAALAVGPAAALAQDAGGHQYQDPLANTPGTHSTPSPPPPGPSAASDGTPASTPSSSASSGSTTTSGTTATATAAGKDAIPRTGFPVGWLTFAGFFALGAGVALRRAAGFERV